MAEKDKNGKRPSEEHEKDPKESIPLWLQGLAADDQPDETEPYTPSLDERTDQVSEPDDGADSVTGPADDIEVLPDWLDEIVAEDGPAELPAEPEEEAAPDAEQVDELTDEVLIDRPEPVEETEISGEDEEVVEAEPDEDEAAFVELSDMDMEDEMLPEEEDLPDWLTDMITEAPTEEEEPTGDRPDDMEQTLTAEAEQAPDNLDEDAGWQHLEETPADWVSFDDSTPVNQAEEDEGEIPEWLIEDSEEDTSPIVINEPEAEDELKDEEGEGDEEVKTSKSVTEDTGSFVPIQPFEMPEPETPSVDMDDDRSDEDELTEEEPEPEPQPVESGDSMPKALRFAKFILDQGEVDRAMEIISTHIGQTDYLDEVEGWITEALDNGIHPSATLWEVLGDIAIAREDYKEATNAYARAMDVLMNREEGTK
ncbi:hypothetical protein KQH56_03630 [bacterium]|nr:hypothetical protein [bacterium]